MVNYHGEDAATQFALVVMNNVARLLRDASIGQNLVILGLNKLQLHTVDVVRESCRFRLLVDVKCVRICFPKRIDSV